MRQEKDNTLNKNKTDTEATAASLTQKGNAEFQLKRLLNIVPGEKEAAQQVSAILNDPGFTEKLSAAQLLDVSRCALEHGLLEKGRELLTFLNNKFPEFEQGWKEHLEVLELLGDAKACVALRYRAKRSLSPECYQRMVASANQERALGTNLATGALAPTALLQQTEDEQDDKDIFESFAENRLQAEQIQRFMSVFRGRDDVFARQWVDRSRQNSGYTPVKRPMTAADVEEHLKGTKTYGIYLMNPDNTVWTGAIDIDLKKQFRTPGALKGLTGHVKREVRFILGTIRSSASIAGMSCIAEFSGGKGYHIWFPVEHAVEASAMRKALSCLTRQIAGKTDFFELEIFPKQDRLSGKGLGNLIKLPLGIHRLTGKRSFFVQAGSRSRKHQLSLLKGVRPTPIDRVHQLASEASKADVIVHPAAAKLAKRFPELFELQQACSVIGRLVTACMSGRPIGERERKVLVSTVGHMNQGRQILHHLLCKTPDYNRPLLDYEISRLRGTPLGCKRIHSLVGLGDGGLDCAFNLKKGEYAHPLLHLASWSKEQVPRQKAERIENLQDALFNLKTAIEIVERFL